MSPEVMMGKWRKSILQGLLDEIETEFVEVIFAKRGDVITVDFKPVKQKEGFLNEVK